MSASFALALTPEGELILADDESAPPLAPAVARRVRSAFTHGGGAGLVHLGAAEASTDLPGQLAFWRALAHQHLRLLRERADPDAPPAAGEPALPDGLASATAASAPPMRGSEHLGAPVVEALWRRMSQTLAARLAHERRGLGELLAEADPAWREVGRVHFHLAERKGDPETPFAFLATYASGAGGKPRHVPLGRALEEFAGQKNRRQLLALLEPIERGAARSPVLRELVDSGDVFHAIGWTPEQTYRFLTDVPAYEAAGIAVRVPDWWRARANVRPQVVVSIGTKPPRGIGLDALLDFDVRVALGGETLTAADLAALRRATDGLVLLRGRWVEVDRERLDAVLAHWKAVERDAPDGVSFLEAMRLLAGAPAGAGAHSGAGAGAGDAVAWSQRRSGAWLAKLLEELAAPSAASDADPGQALHTSLRTYQRAGVAWLWRLAKLGLGGCLADDMGLGKTVQVLALLLCRKRQKHDGPALLVVPASLLGNWQAEAARFAPSLSWLVAHPSGCGRDELARLDAKSARRHDVVISTYAYLSKLAWAREVDWGLVALDEAQQIKNAGTAQARAVKALKARARVALTGTPLENRLADLWSLFDFLNPGLLGSAKTFGTFVKTMEKAVPPSYAPLRALVRPYLLRRLKTDRAIIADLPEKTEVRAWCSLSRAQAGLYQDAVEDLAARLERTSGMERRGLVLATLTRLKQICNHPAHATRNGDWTPEESGKLARLREIAEEIAARQQKALVFTQYREATAPLARFLAGVFGKDGVVLTGETAVGKRAALVQRFQEGDAPFFVLSLKAGGTGLNLTAASHVVHFDRWWNPAVEAQATDRAFRIGQRRNVLVHAFVCRGTVEERIDAMLADKKKLVGDVLGESGGELALTELSNEELMRVLALDVERALAEG